jgi:hypothetical protein
MLSGTSLKIPHTLTSEYLDQHGLKFGTESRYPAPEHFEHLDGPHLNFSVIIYRNHADFADK